MTLKESYCIFVFKNKSLFSIDYYNKSEHYLSIHWTAESERVFIAKSGIWISGKTRLTDRILYLTLNNHRTDSSTDLFVWKLHIGTENIQ